MKNPHNPVEYATRISCPTLLFFGAKDDKVSKREIEEIFENLTGPKELKIFEEAGHENFLLNYESEWTREVQQFLEMNR
ncbi:MAG: dienelactone hydrolase family protein [Cyclobacteriaceae bacterium]|nr:dienelactone hydrolase family protein [Cyclobacteriaceae bacterium]